MKFETNWRTAWEAASQRCGELMEKNRSLRKLHELEIADKDAVIVGAERDIIALNKEILAKDARIAELEGVVKDLEEEVDGLLIQQIGSWDGE